MRARSRVPPVVFVQNFACAISQKVRNFTALPLMLMDLSTTALAA